MDVNEILNYFQVQSLPSMESVSFDQRMEETTSASTFPSLSQSELDVILNSLFPSEGTNKCHIDNSINNSDHVVNLDYDCNGKTLECVITSSTEDTPQNCKCVNFTGNSVLDTLDTLLKSSFSNNKPNSSSSSDIADTFSPMETNTTSYPTQNSPLPSSLPYNGSKNVDTLPQQLRQPYNDHQSNFLKPIDPDFKPVISLCTDTSKVEEPWKPVVVKQILAVYYTPLDLKSESLGTQTALDEFQSLALKEAVAAFHDIALVNTIIYKLGKSYPDSCPKTLVRACTKVRAYRRLHDEDKVTLLSSVFFDVIAMKSVLTYDNLTDSWNCSGIRVDRREIFRLDASLHNGIVHVIETFPDRWRRDLIVATLLYLIMIFNPDLANLKFEESIRREQYTYIYLLQRYLETTCEYPCDAQDYLYRLMVKIAEIKNIRKYMRNVFEMFMIKFSLSNCISKLVQCNGTS